MVPAEEQLLGGARFDPAEADRLQPIHHVSGGEFARHVRAHIFAGIGRRVVKTAPGHWDTRVRRRRFGECWPARKFSGEFFGTWPGPRRPGQRGDCPGQLSELRRRCQGERLSRLALLPERTRQLRERFDWFPPPRTITPGRDPERPDRGERPAECDQNALALPQAGHRHGEHHHPRQADQKGRRPPVRPWHRAILCCRLTHVQELY